MRVSERLKLIDEIGRELQKRYTYKDIDIFFKSYGIAYPEAQASYNSKWIYAKEALANASDKLVQDIAEELELSIKYAVVKEKDSPEIWQETNLFRLFISHIAVHKDKAFRMKEALAPYNISAFVAHEDINPTQQWQVEIEKALNTMDAMLAIHTDGFSKSFWTNQEIGFALGRPIKILSLKLNEDPKGFISKHQAILRRRRNADEIAKEINSILRRDILTKDRMTEANSEN